MACFNEAYEVLVRKEYSSKSEKFIHQNSTESQITVGGIYRKANPTALDWDFIDNIIEVCRTKVTYDTLKENEIQYKKDLKRASTMIFYDKKIRDEVYTFFKLNYWDTLKLDEVQNNLIATQIFLFGVVSGVRNSAKVTQRAIGVLDDGIVGNITIKALNIQSRDNFYNKFREKELAYYDALIENNPKLAIYEKGWSNRGKDIEV